MTNGMNSYVLKNQNTPLLTNFSWIDPEKLSGRKTAVISYISILILIYIWVRGILDHLFPTG